MTPAAVVSAQDVAAAAHALSALSGDVRRLAGGQSLIPAMRLGLAAPDALVDLSQAHDLRGIVVDEREIRIGAMEPHAHVASSAVVQAACPALAALAGGIGDQQVRNLGTIGGSLANADPAACYPSAVLALNATIVTDRRVIAADDFFLGLYETAIVPGEIITQVRFPRVRQCGYAKFKQPASRFALVGVFVARTAAGVRVAVTGAGSHAFRATMLEDALAADFRPEAARRIKIEPDGLNTDLHATAAYRAHLISVLAARAVKAALG